MDKRAPPKILEGHSPVNQYELLALEQNSQGLTEERMVLAFQALDELIPKLGVYTRLFSKLRDDFFKAVYSDELTGVSESGENGGEGTSYIQRLPFFVLVKRVYDDRHDLTEELKEQLDIVKERLFQKHKQYEQSQEEVARLKEHVDHLLQTKDDLQNIIADKDGEINRLENEMEENQRDWENRQHQLECDIADLKESLADAKNEIEFLSQFKKGYDDMYYAFMDKQNEEVEEIKRKQKSAIATKRAYVMTDIESANHMEEQILTVMNTALEEFDKFLEGHKQELEEKVVTSEMTDAELDLQELELDEADQELEVVQHRFEQTVGSMLSELELLRKHNTMLMEQLQVLEESKPQPKKKDTGRSKGSEGKHGESILWAGLEEDEGQEEMADPFIPQERVFSKYAAMLYTSNNTGKTFEEFKDAKYCASCGEKTVICPHKMGGAEKVFVLPHNCTHIKIARPKVRINREFVQMLMKPESPEPTFDLAPSVSSAARSYQSGMQPQDLAVTPTTSHDSPSYGMGEAYMVHTMQRVWDDYRRRTSLERNIPRTLSLELTKSLLEQFCAYIVLQDEHGEEDQGVYSILDTLYRFMQRRYLVDDMMYLATHDFLSSVIEYSGNNKMIQLLGHVLVGNLDASCLRYVLLIADFIELVDWVEVEDFRAFASVVYPFLTEDDLESLQMSYTSFSENHISRQLVCDFLIHIILKYREPRFQDLENKLVPFQSSESGQLTDKEHKDALDNIVPLCNERVRRRLFVEAEKAVKLDGVLNAVPIARLARILLWKAPAPMVEISGYLALQQITTIIKDNINQRIIEWRDRPSSAGSARQTMEFHHALDPAGEQKLLTLSKVKTLASNMSRTAKHREDRQNQSYDDDEYDNHEEDGGW
ncbi:hypothetical protein BaRGS_00013765 [Batillaria attramentaria]|uniref:Uncharacterized protein n=1 Tax=Batillaria attramentaria TaxID=370345 RepID=A0ABD0L6L2_9CAEN